MGAAASQRREPALGELMNAVESAVILCGGDELLPEHSCSSSNGPELSHLSTAHAEDVYTCATSRISPLLPRLPSGDFPAGGAGRNCPLPACF